MRPPNYHTQPDWLSIPALMRTAIWPYSESILPNSGAVLAPLQAFTCYLPIFPETRYKPLPPPFTAKKPPVDV